MENNEGQFNEPVSQALPPGYELDDYVIEEEIGSGGFGITYKAYDKHLNRPVAIKEYFPFNLASRDGEMNVSPKTRVNQDVDDYTWGLSRFIQEARTLAMFEHPSIIRVIRYIERNRTAYIIMEFAEGRDVSEVLKNDGLLRVEELKAIILPIAEGLASVHSANMLHRDIKPGNIRVRENASAVLIDFGAARQAIGALSQSISTILTPGYAPIEQYSTRGNQGPWTDLYALAAVGYVCLTGENLSHYEATERIRNDQLPKLADRVNHSDTVFLRAIDWALSPEEEDRPQTVEDWLDAIKAQVIPGPGGTTDDQDRTKKIDDSGIERVAQKLSDKAGTSDARKSKSFHWSAVVIVFGLVVGGFMFYLAAGINETPNANNRVVRNDSKTASVEKMSTEQSAPKEKSGQAYKKPQEALVPKTKTPKPVAVNPQPESKNLVQDDRDFGIASRINTAEAYELYLRLHPNGRHRSKIRNARR